MGRLILIRHGETNKNTIKTLHAMNDLETLNPTGRQQIEKTALKLKDLSPFAIYTSKEKRALESAEMLSGRLGIPLKEIDGIQERNWGIFTGKSWDELRIVLEPMTMEERYNYVPTDGESWSFFEKRLIKAIKKIIKENKDRTLAIVTHGGVIKTLMPFLLNVPKEKSINFIPDNASITIFDFDDKGFHKVVINDKSHLS